jgi:hypothetical protein
MQSIISALTIDISSITIVSIFENISFLCFDLALVFHFFCASLYVIVVGNQKKECIVTPPTLSAATQVGARTTVFFFVFLRK